MTANYGGMPCMGGLLLLALGACADAAPAPHCDDRIGGCIPQAGPPCRSDSQCNAYQACIVPRIVMSADAALPEAGIAQLDSELPSKRASISRFALGWAAP